MLDKSSLKMARELASHLCQARHLAEDLSQELDNSAQEAKNAHIETALAELAEEIAGYAEELNYMEGKLDDVVEPYDADLAS